MTGPSDRTGGRRSEIVVHRLAAGLAIVDGRTGEPADVDVADESVPVPFRRPPAAMHDPGIGLPRWRRAAIGRVRVVHPHNPAPLPAGVPPPATASKAIRIVDRGRRFVPRRLTVPVPTLPAVLAAEVAHAAGPRRSWRIAMFPGAGYPLSGGITAIRGRVVDEANVPVPWVQVLARIVDIGANQDGPVIGRAHGDDRGEFVMILLAHAEAVAGAETMTIALRLTIGVPPAPPPADPDRGDLLDPAVDPLALLPTAKLPTVQSPDDVSAGEAIPADFRRIGPISLDVRIGRIQAPAPFVLPP